MKSTGLSNEEISLKRKCKSEELKMSLSVNSLLLQNQGKLGCLTSMPLSLYAKIAW